MVSVLSSSVLLFYIHFIMSPTSLRFIPFLLKTLCPRTHLIASVQSFPYKKNLEPNLTVSLSQAQVLLSPYTISKSSCMTLPMPMHFGSLTSSLPMTSTSFLPATPTVTPQPFSGFWHCSPPANTNSGILMCVPADVLKLVY